MRTYIRNKLFQSSRPGYPSENVSLKEVEAWMDTLKEKGVKTIICLLSEDQLNYYDEINGGLLNVYKEAGFNVFHEPITDPANDSRGWQELNDRLNLILDVYKKGEKPVLIHCSAGVDRSPRAARFIVDNVEQE